MKYVTGVFIAFYLLLLDLSILIASALLAFIPVFILISDGDYPISYKFVKRLWLDNE